MAAKSKKGKPDKGAKVGSPNFRKNPESKLGSGASGPMAGLKTPTELEGLHLKTFKEGTDDEPAPVGHRLADVTAATGLYVLLRRADEASAVARARIDGMFDGVAPWDQAKLNATKQGQKTNVNFGQAQRILDIALSAFVDLYTSLETYMEVHAKNYDRDEETFAKQQVTAEELSETLRSWPEFHSNYLRLCNTFLKHGVGISYFDNPTDFRFRIGGFDDILIPRMTPASEEQITVAIAQTDYQVHELWGFIKNREVAEKRGWDVNEVIRLLNENVTTVGTRSGQVGSSAGYDYEAWQATFKNNDIYIGIENPTVSILHFWVRETDGTISHQMCAEKNPKCFVYQKAGAFERPEQAFVFFTNGVGSNGTYHSIRALGQRIFAHCQILNKMRCHAIDGAVMGSSIMIQPLNQRGVDELEFTYYGAFSVLSPDAQIVDKALPNMSQTMQPVMNDITQQLLENTDTVTAYGPDRGSPYRNQMQVSSDLEISSRISGSTINLFYQAWGKLMREVTRRIIQGNKSDPAIRGFYDRCAARGVDEAFIKTLDLDRTEATRSVGDGSAANRHWVQKELEIMSGQLDEVGQRNLIHDKVAGLVGYKLANRYAPAPSAIDGTERSSVDTKIAMLENEKLAQGMEIPPLSHEMHGKHLREHIPLAQQYLTGIEDGQVDPVQVIPVLKAIYDHLSETANMAATNPNLEAVVAETVQVLQLLEEQIYNAQKAEAKMEREAQQTQMDEVQAAAQEGMEAQAQAEMGAEPSPALTVEDENKVRRAEIDMDITRQKADLDLTIRREKHQQEMAQSDAKTAQKILNEEKERQARSMTGVSTIGR